MLLHARSWALAEKPRSVWTLKLRRLENIASDGGLGARLAKVANRGIIRGLCKPAGPAPAGPPCGSRGQALLYNSAPLHTQFTLFVSRRTHCVPCTDTLSLSPPPFLNSYLPHRHPKPYKRTAPHLLSGSGSGKTTLPRFSAAGSKWIDPSLPLSGLVGGRARSAAAGTACVVVCRRQ